MRRDLPRGTATLYYNEAFAVVAPGICKQSNGSYTPCDYMKPKCSGNFSYPRVPENLDWISLDYCESFRDIVR